MHMYTVTVKLEWTLSYIAYKIHKHKSYELKILHIIPIQNYLQFDTTCI